MAKRAGSLLYSCRNAALLKAQRFVSVMAQLCLLAESPKELKRIVALEIQLATFTAARGQPLLACPEAVPGSRHTENAGQVDSVCVSSAAHTAVSGGALDPNVGAELDPSTPPAASEHLVRSRPFPDFMQLSL